MLGSDGELLVLPDRCVGHGRLCTQLPEMKSCWFLMICLTGVSAQDKTDIVDRHNHHRGLVSPTSSNMLKMTWDDEIAMIAQRWADACQMNHDSGDQRSIPGLLSVGQNIASGATSWQQVVDLWQKEVSDFKYNQKGNELEKVGHYTQVVWADSNRIGCGYSMCGTTSYYVCNYGPGGNLGGINTPYKAGTSCSDCAGQCDGTLCNCASTCYNGAELIRNNCTCKCKWDFYSGDACQLDCKKTKKDPDFCGTDYGNNACSLISQDCPYKCKVCPYGGIGYVEGSEKVEHRPGGGGPGLHGSWTLLAVLVYLVAHHTFG